MSQVLSGAAGMSFTVGDWISLLGVGGAILVPVVGLLIRWVVQRTDDNRSFFEKELGDVAAQLGATRAIVDIYRDQLKEHQIEVAKNYVRNEHLKEAEGRILARFDRLEAKLDRRFMSGHEA
jgi:hypothetical protein